MKFSSASLLVIGAVSINMVLANDALNFLDHRILDEKKAPKVYKDNLQITF